MHPPHDAADLESLQAGQHAQRSATTAPEGKVGLALRCEQNRRPLDMQSANVTLGSFEKTSGASREAVVRPRS